MNSIDFSRRISVVTGIPQNPQTGGRGNAESTQNTASFQELLQRNLEATTNLTFSKHAAQRAEQRGIDLSAQNLSRLNEGARLAQEKGLGDTLILVDNTAFLVNVRSNKVITTVDSKQLQGNVFTNIDGTVII